MWVAEEVLRTSQYIINFVRYVGIYFTCVTPTINTVPWFVCAFFSWGARGGFSVSPVCYYRRICPNLSRIKNQDGQQWGCLGVLMMMHCKSIWKEDRKNGSLLTRYRRARWDVHVCSWTINSLQLDTRYLVNEIEERVKYKGGCLIWTLTFGW